MRRFCSARRALLAATACSAVVFPVLFTPSAAWADSPNAEACSGLYHGTPPGSLVMTPSVPAGTVLHPGDSVDVTATWDTNDWPGPVLHKVLDCLLVNGSVDYDHSSQEKPTDNDGLYRYRFTVPAGTEAGRVCDRVRLSGRLAADGDLVVQKSNTVCYTVSAAGKAGVPGVPAGPTTSPGLPAPETTLETTPDTTPVLQPAAAVSDSPAPAVGPPAPMLDISAATAVPSLPRTGAGDIVPLSEFGALLVLLGGAALAARWIVARRQDLAPQLA